MAGFDDINQSIAALFPFDHCWSHDGRGQWFSGVLEFRAAAAGSLAIGPRIALDRAEKEHALINIVIALVIVGVVLYLINRYIPMASSIKSILNVVVVVAVGYGFCKLWDCGATSAASESDIKFDEAITTCCPRPSSASEPRRYERRWRCGSYSGGFLVGRAYNRYGRNCRSGCSLDAGMRLAQMDPD